MTAQFDLKTMTIPQWIINPFGDIEEINVKLQEPLIGISTIEELKLQFRNSSFEMTYSQQLIPYYGSSWKYFNLFFILYSCRKTKYSNRLDIDDRDLKFKLF